MELYRLPRQLAAALILCFALLEQATVSTPKPVTLMPTARASERPFRMLVLGDSVMWGQGLADKNKFSRLTAQWICEQRNGGTCPLLQDVDLQIEAHSGAVLAAAESKSDQNDERDCLQESVPLRCQGEVPYAYPTIWSQVDLALRHYSKRQISAETIDLILVDGGINDLGAPKILLPIFGGDIRQRAKDFCYEPMKKLLVKTHAAFPNAIIVVAGYFPLVSKDTPLDIIVKTIRDLFPHVELSAGDKKAIKESAEAEAETVGVMSGRTNPAKANGVIETLPERSKKWKDASDEALRKAVDEFNNIQTASATSAPAIFAGIRFDDENAYAAAKSFLWQLGPKGMASFECPNDLGLLGKLLGNLIVNDEQQSIRPCTCIRAGMNHGGQAIACMRAGAFHPNTLGAQRYFDSIKGKLETLREKGVLKL